MQTILSIMISFVLFCTIRMVKLKSLASSQTQQSSSECTRRCGARYAYYQEFPLSSISCRPWQYYIQTISTDCLCPIGYYYELGNQQRTVGCHSCPPFCRNCSNPYFCDDGTCSCTENEKQIAQTEETCLKCFQIIKIAQNIRLLDIYSCGSGGNTGCSCVWEHQCYQCYDSQMQVGSHCINPSSLIICDVGYYFESPLCRIIIIQQIKYNPPCYGCASSATNCQSCVAKTYLSGNSCLDCNTSCATCTSSSYCTSCISGYFLSGATCIDCNPCLLCTNTTNCQSCIDGYYLSGTTCMQCTAPCLTASGSIITSCILTTYLSVNSCISCVSPCVQCTSPTMCQSCINGYYLSMNTCQLIITQCIPTTYQSGNTCPSCVSPCVNCTSLVRCTSCISQYYLSGTTCLYCTSPCLSASNSEITQCIPTTFLSGPSLCASCVSPCLNCINANSCQSCVSGYYFDGVNACYPCRPPCQTCEGNAMICTSCLPTTYLKDNECPNCVSPCATCTSSIDCVTCINGYYLDIIQGCVICQVGCAYCIDGSSCQVCIELYYYKNMTQCQLCQSPCLTCLPQLDINNNNLCLSCVNNLSLTNYQCTCLVGQYLDNESCKQCDQHCLQCTADRCLQCKDQNTMIINITKCICKDGYYNNNRYSVETYHCSPCTLPCRTCSGSANTCTSCITTTYLSDTESTCLQCKLPCTSCIHQSTYCLSCNGINIQVLQGICQAPAGYFYNYSTNEYDQCHADCGLCTEFDQCITCSFMNSLLSNGNCSCLDNYYLERPQMCTQCKKECLTCISQTQCLTCSSKYYLVGYQCQQCSQGCDECSDSSNCLQCTQGYTSVDHSYSQYVTCQIVSQATKEYTQNSIQSATYMLWILLGLFIFELLAGGIENFYNLLDLIQLVSYLQFINTVLPYNFTTFLNLFQFTQFQFISGFFNVQTKLESTVQASEMFRGPQKIIDQGYTSLSLINTTSAIVIFTSLFFIYFICKIAMNILSRVSRWEVLGKTDWSMRRRIITLKIKQYLLGLTNKIVQETFYSGIYRTYYSIAYDQVFNFTLNLSVADFNDTDNPTLTLSEYLALTLLFLYLFALCHQIHILNCTKHIIHTSKFKSRYGSIVQGLNIQEYCIYFNVFLMVKKLLYMGSIIIFYYNPLFQAINIVFYSLIEKLFLSVLGPLKDKQEQLKMMVSEICIFIVEGVVLILVLDDYIINNIINRNILGWIGIVGILLMLITQILFDIRQQWSLYLKVYRFMKSYLIKPEERRRQVSYDLSLIQV